MFYYVAGLGGDFAGSIGLHSIIFRTFCALCTALAIVLTVGVTSIARMRLYQKAGQPIRSDGPATHLVTKKGTPTMGGLMILFGMISSMLLWADLASPQLWIVLAITLGYGCIGFCDDYFKLSGSSERGLSGRARLLLGGVLALLGVCALLYVSSELSAMSVHVPGFRNLLIPLGFLFPVFGALTILGCANGVNLTDGLDGLATVPVVFSAAVLGIVAYLAGDFALSGRFQIPHVAGVGELTVFCGAMIGAALGFLWFNAPPAMIFMGDTGSLSLGAALGVVAVAVRHELLLAIIGGVFVLEVLSVIIQVISFKSRGKRVFLMAPLHHHFEQKGWPESRIVVRFWIISALLAIAGLATLKLH